MEQPWTRHSLYRRSDGVLITEYLCAPRQGISWRPDLGDMPDYGPESYEWRVTEVGGESSDLSDGNVLHTITVME